MSREAWTVVGLALGLAAAVASARRSEVEQPLPVLASSASAVEAETCAECHNDIYRKFDASPHHLTLRRADDKSVWAFFAAQHADTQLGRFRFERQSQQLWFSSDRHPQRVAVDWIFGSGHDALTPVAVRENHRGQLELNQLHISWFPGTGLGLTFGSEGVHVNPASLGIHHSHQQTEDCFGCHATYLPRDEGRIDLARMLPGVTCSRCHPGGQEHVDSDGEIPTWTAWQELTPLESIQRCGECHRRADQMTDDEIHLERADQLARFAPVGLVQSRCFTQPLADAEGQLLRMDCMTCHDPHSVTVTEPVYYRRRCMECHGEQPHQAPVCSENPMTTNCLPCHMPKVPITKHLSVTDHWIRSTSAMPVPNREPVVDP